MIGRRALLGAAAAACAAPVRAQPPAPAPAAPRRIGLLRWDTPEGAVAAIEGLRRRLAELGWRDGETIVLDVGYADGDAVLAEALVRAMIARGAAVIVAASTPAVRAAMAATREVPIVMAPAADPVANGYVASLARPGGNVTGTTLGGPELSAKRVELLREMVPALTRVGFLGSARDPAAPIFAAQTGTAAAGLGLGFAPFYVEDRSGLAPAFAAIAAAAIDALVVQPILVFERDAVAALALRHRLPTISELRPMAESGCLMSYGSGQDWGAAGAATFVDRILRGARAADLPVERPTRIELVVNLRTARALGLVPPGSILARADAVIE